MGKNEEIVKLWKLIEEKDYDVLSERLANLKINNESISLPLKDLLKSFLWTIVNLSVLKKSGGNFISLPNDIQADIKIDVNNNDGRITFLFSCLNQTKVFQKLFDEEVIIEENWKISSLVLLQSLIEDTDECCLIDGTPIVNLIILAGKELNIPKNYENLLRTFFEQIDLGKREKSHVHQLCPYTKESTIDVYLRTTNSKTNTLRNNKIHFDLAKLSELGSTPNSKLATFYEIRDEIDKNEKIKFKIPDPTVKPDLLQSTEIVKNEISSMLKGKDHFSKKIKDAFVPMWTIGDGNPDQIEQKVAENVIYWLKKSMENCKESFHKLPASSSIRFLNDNCKINLSGSMSEGTRVKAKKNMEDENEIGSDEIEVDLILSVKLEAKTVISDHGLGGAFIGNINHKISVMTELRKCQNKNPFSQIGFLELSEHHKTQIPNITEETRCILAPNFVNEMTEYVCFVIENGSDGNVPRGLDEVDDIMSCVKKTKSGIYLGFTYKNTIPVSIDIVSLIPLGMDKEWLQKAIKMFPKHDSRKLDYLVNNNFVSNSDGMVAKDWAWRLSFSCSEARLLKELDKNCIYKSLKYLSCISGHKISSYFLKEMTLSYLVDCAMNNKSSYSQPNSPLDFFGTLMDVFRYAENNFISNPFYCSTAGSAMHTGCKDLIIMVLLSKGYIMQNFDRGIDADTMNSIFAAAPSPTPDPSPPAFHQPFKNVAKMCSIPLIGTRKYLQHLLKNNFNSKNT